MAIVLGPAFEVSGLRPEECTAAHDFTGADLLIVCGDVSPSAALVQAAARLPVLRIETEVGFPELTGRSSASLPLSFRPEHLRHEVRQLLVTVKDVPTISPSFLKFPFLSRENEALAHRAAATLLPVVIAGEPGCGKSRLARAIHSASNLQRFLSLPAESLTRTVFAEMNLAAGSYTLYVHDVARLGSEAQRLLLELCQANGFESRRAWHQCRIICSTTQSLEALACDASFNRDLYYRLSVLPLTLAPLRERSADIGDLAVVVARDLGEFLDSRRFVLTQRAIERMERYMWFGNFTEFEAVLLRSMALAQTDSLDAEDLLFDATRITLRPTPKGIKAAVAEQTASPETDATPPNSASSKPADTVDLVIQELAHEFRNPMVTIKTLTQRLERLLEDEASRTQVTRLTGEAVERMDRTLENLLQFTRFGDPVPETISLSPLVTNCLSHLSPAFAERQVVLNYEPPEAHRVEVDGAQVGYALENLLRVVLRDLRDGDTLAIHPLNGHGISLEFPARGQLVADKLTRMVDHAPDEAAAQSIGFLFAKALVERNGGSIEVHPQTGRTVIAVALPGQGEVAAKNGNTTSTSSR